mgnify:CR=1 FL=1
MNYTGLVENILNKAYNAFHEVKQSQKFKEKIKKGYGGDITLYFDEYVEEVIINELKDKVGKILSEEKGIIEGYGEGIAIVDPVDGSTNTFRDLPFCATTLVLAKGERFQDIIISGTIDLIRGDMFISDGNKTYLNGKEVKTSKTVDLNEVIASIDVKLTKESIIYGKTLNKILEAVRYIRFFGAIALDLAYVASGKLDAFIVPTPRVRLLDIVGGMFMVKNAGGYVEILNYDLNKVSILENKRVAVLVTNNEELAKKIKDIILNEN